MYNYLNLDKILSGEKKVVSTNTGKQSFNYGDIENEAALVLKGVSNSYSEALDALKSELLKNPYCYNNCMIFSLLFLLHIYYLLILNLIIKTEHGCILLLFIYNK